MKMKRIWWGFLMIAAVALAGCGGGSGGSGSSSLQDMLDTVTEERDTARASVAELTTMLTEANAEAMRLQGLLDAAPSGADATELQTKLDDANAMVATLTTDLATANAELTEIREKTAGTMAKAMRDDRIAREVRVGDSIRSDAVRVASATARRFPTEAVSGVLDVLTVKRDAAGMVTIDVNGVDADNDVYDGGEVTAGSGAWTSALLTKTDADTEAQDVVAFYTDIAAPSDKKFTNQYDQTTVLDNILNVAAEAATARFKLVMSSGFPSDPSTTWVYDGSQAGRSKSVAGTFDGVAGQYTCTAASCTVSTNTMGRLSDSLLGWRFTPNSPNTATVKDPDTGYAYFGWWLNKPKKNTDPHSVDVFAGGTNVAPVVIELEGNATYSGPASGKYATKTFSAGAQTDAGVGHFTANANLTAKFGADNVAGLISGSVSGFVLDDTDSSTASAWRVVLEQTSIQTTGRFGGKTEVDFGAGLSKNDDADEVEAHPGSWQGSFYGPGATSVALDKRHPSTVAGTFDAEMTNAAVIGGFGATKN